MTAAEDAVRDEQIRNLAECVNCIGTERDDLRDRVAAAEKEAAELRSDNERISAAWADVIQREQRSDNAHFYDMEQMQSRLAQTERFMLAFQGEADQYRELLQQITGELHALFERTSIPGLQQITNTINTTLAGGEAS